ncbi:MAG: ROK family protein [Hyphomicrobiaceae bacterium]
MTRTAIGIDLGGTNVRICLLSADGRRLRDHFAAVPRADSAAHLIEHLAQLVRQVQGDATPTGIGLGVAGALDAQDCLLAGMTNLPVLAGVPLATALGDLASLPVLIDNDARVAMRGEARFGGARACRNALLVTLGTGIGSGLLLDGQVRQGPNRLAGELGLALESDPTAAAGWIALEDVASPGGLKRTRGLDLAQTIGLAAAGDDAAARDVDHVCTRLAVAIVNAQVLLDLEAVLLSGGAAVSLLAGIRGAYARLCPPAFQGKLAIEMAALGEWAGAVGAAALWFEGPGNTP